MDILLWIHPSSGARNSSCSVLEMGVGAPGAKRTWRISCSKIPGQELFHSAGLQQLWTGHLSLSKCSGRKVNTTFLWGDGNGQEINYFLGKNPQKFQKNHPHPVGSAEEEQLGTTSLMPSSHRHKPFPGHPLG